MLGRTPASPRSGLTLSAYEPSQSRNLYGPLFWDTSHTSSPVIANSYRLQAFIDENLHPLCVHARMAAEEIDQMIEAYVRAEPAVRRASK